MVASCHGNLSKIQYGECVETQGKTQLSAVHARFALSFPILFFLSLGAHIVGGGGLPTMSGLFAGAIFAALFSAMVSRSRLTVVSVATAALMSQFMVHLSFHYVQALGSGHIHGAAKLDLGPAAGTADHAMFTAPMAAAHLIAGVLVAVVLVQVDQFLEYLRSAARRFVSLLRPVILIALRVRSSPNFFAAHLGIHVCLEVLTKRGPPLSLKCSSI